MTISHDIGVNTDNGGNLVMSDLSPNPVVPTDPTVDKVHEARLLLTDALEYHLALLADFNELVGMSRGLLGAVARMPERASVEVDLVCRELAGWLDGLDDA